MENAVTEDTDLGRLIEWFKAAEDQTQESRAASERARDYRDHHQLTDEEKTELRKRGQPPVVINRIARKVDWLLGLEAQRRTDPRAFPRTPASEQSAEAATDAIKYVCDNADWDMVKSGVYDNMIVEGFGGCEVAHKVNKRGDVEITLHHYPWDRLFYDPHSSRSDFRDARYLGAVVWKDAATLKDEYPKQAGDLSEMMEDSRGTTYDDRPANGWAVDAGRNRVRCIIMYYREKGEWHWCKFAGTVKLEAGKSPYVDEDGESMCPLILQSAYVDRKNNRYGIVHGMFDPQDEINKRRSRALFMLSQRQTVGEEGAVKSIAAMKREMARPDGHVEVMADTRFEVLPSGELLTGQFNLLQEAKNEIDMMGANAALSGEGSSSQSGRAVLAKQQGGMVEIAPVLDRLQMLSREVYRHIWARVRQFWTEEKWIRVTDDERNARFVGLNRRLTLADQLQQMPPEQAAGMARQMGLVPGDPRLQQQVGVENAVAEIDVDIILDEVPDAVTLQGETFEQLVGLMQGGVPIPPEVLVENIPGLRRDKKDKIIEMLEQQRQAAQQAQEAQAPAQQAQQAAMIKKTEAEAFRAMAAGQADGAKVEISAFTAGQNAGSRSV